MSLFSLNCDKFITDYFNIIKNKDYHFVTHELSSCTLYALRKKLKNHFIYVSTNDYVLFLKKVNGFCRCIVTPFHINKDCFFSKDVRLFIDVMKKYGKLYKSDLIIPLFMSDDISKEFSNSKEFKLKFFCDEFIYDKNAVINMVGHVWKRKRNAINHFKRSYPNSFVRLATMQDFDKILKVREIWRSRKSIKFKIIDDDFFETEIQFLLSKFGSQFGKVFVCEVDNNVVAFCSVSHLCKNTLYTGHNNYLSEYNGVNEYLYRETLIQCDYPEEFVNDGGADVKNPCYAVKMHYNPVDINHIYALYVR